MNKTQLIEKIARDLGISKASSERALNSFADIVGGELARGRKVTVTGFGTFLVSKRKSREGVDPQTGERITIPALKLPHFRPGTGFKDKIR